MKTCRFTLAALLLFSSMLGLIAQEARFFRVVGPVPVTIAAISADGYVTWTNELTNATFTVQTATTLGGQSNWVDWVRVPVTNVVTTHRVFDLIPPDGMAFIPAGSFVMGDTFTEGNTSERPLHTVYVSALYMDKFEVTKALWDEVYLWATNHGYSFSNPGLGKSANHPVQSISWHDAIKWCNARSEMETLTPCYFSTTGQTNVLRTGFATALTSGCVNWLADGYRLPTEAEWEKAARGGFGSLRFPWSDSVTISHSRANYYTYWPVDYDLNPAQTHHPAFATNGSPYTSPVGYFMPNGYGLYDMAGNVFEWCWDWYWGNSYLTSPAIDPTGYSSGEARVLRGGSWSHDAGYCRTAARFNGYMGANGSYIGFRCVRRL